jgi:FkbM family methyltransferase
MKTLIEVGAYDGTDSLRYHADGYRVYTFEPKTDLYENLVQKTKQFANYTVIKKAVSQTDGKTQFNICNLGGASSILPFRPNHELIQAWSAKRTDIHYSGLSYEVETIRLDTFIEQNGLQNTIIDMIHIDAQGVDLACLKSLGKYINNVKSGVVETIIDTNKSIYIGQTENTLANVQQFLYSNGFKIAHIESNDPTQCEYNVYFSKA